MSLQKQIVDIPLGAGLDSKSDPKVVQPGAMLVVENGEFDESGAVTKRNGYAALSASKVGGGSISKAVGLYTHDDELLMLDGDNLYSWSPTASKWASKGALRPVDVRASRIATVSPSFTVMTIDCAVVGNVAVYAWGTGSATYGMVVDLATGSNIVNPTQLQGSGGATVRVISSGTLIYVVTDAGGNTLNLYVLDTASPTSFGGAVALASNLTTGGAFVGFDVADCDNAGTAVVSWHTTVPNIKTSKFNSSGLTGSTVTTADTIAANGMGVVVSAAGDIYTCYTGAANLRCFALTSGMASKFAPTTLTATGVTGYLPCGIEQETNNIFWYYTDSAAAPNFKVRRIDINSAGTVGATSGLVTVVVDAYIVSRPFTYDSSYYINVAHTPESVAQQTCTFMMNVTSTSSWTPVARILPGQGLPSGLVASNAPRPSHVVSYASGKYLFGVQAMYSNNFLGDVSTAYPKPTVVKLDFTAKPTAAPLGKNLHIASGQLWEYDGTAVFENNFHLFPEVSVVAAAAAGSLADATYQFAAVYAWWDERGQMHTSAPSVVASATVSGGGGSGKVTVTVSNLTVTSRSQVRILIYATDAGGSTFYEVTALSNSTTSHSQSYSFTTVSGITDNRILYTVGGVLENGAPPCLESIIAKGPRLYGTTSDGALWYTKEHVDGEAAAFVEETLVKTLYADGGEHYRLTKLDDSLVVFGENSIQLLQGEGLNDTGTSDTLSEPRSIATDTGALAGTPIVTSDSGIYFKSAGGLNLLTRSLQLAYVGAPVEDYNPLTLVSAVVVPSKSQVRFGHSDGSAVVFDYTANAWSTFTGHTQVGACYWGTAYCFVTSAGVVNQQSTGFTDGDGSSITLTLETPWIKLTGLQGYQRLWYASIVGEFRSAHTLTVTPYFDYSQSSGTAVSLAQTGSSGDPLQFRTNISRPCQAVKFRIADSSQSGTKESCALTAISLEIGAKGGLYRLATSKTV